MNINKVIWVTGASSGIGRALALQYAQQNGVALILSARRTQVLESVKQACGGGSKIALLPFDLTQTDQAEQYVTQALQLFGRIDVLINNGGVSQRSKILDTNFEVFETLMQVDYLGSVALTRALLPHFVLQKSGHFVTVTSVMGKYGSPFRSGYCGAKHALHGFFDVLRMEHAKDGIAVTLLCPGFVRTQVTVNALTGDGSALGHDDPATASGLEVNAVAKRMIRAIAQKKWEVYFGRKEKLGVYLKRLSNKLLHQIVIRSKVR